MSCRRPRLTSHTQAPQRPSPFMNSPAPTSQLTLQRRRRRIMGCFASLEISERPHDRAMLGQGHQRGQGNPLPPALVDETRAKAVPTKIFRSSVCTARHCTIAPTSRALGDRAGPTRSPQGRRKRWDVGALSEGKGLELIYRE